MTIPNQPEECTRRTPHTPLIVDAELSVLLRRERGQVDLANDKQAACALFNRSLKQELEAVE